MALVNVKIPLSDVVPGGSTMALHTGPVAVGQPQTTNEAAYGGYSRIPVPADGGPAAWPPSTGPATYLTAFSIAGPDGAIDAWFTICDGALQDVQPGQAARLENTFLVNDE